MNKFRYDADAEEEDDEIDIENNNKVKKNGPVIERENNKVLGNTSDYKSFHYLENGKIDYSIISTKFTTKKLLPGIYDLYSTYENGYTLSKLSVNNDKENYDQELSFLFEDKLKNIYKSFFNKKIKAMVNLLGYNHKLGVILFGKQGTGKTSMFKKYFKKIVNDEKGLVFNISRLDEFITTWEFVQNIRKIQNNPIVIFIDESEEMFNQQFNYESILKKIMDGFESIDNCFFMMATNYIDRVPSSIKNRKSRVKYLIEVKGIEDLEVIKKFLTNCFDKINIKHYFSNDLEKMKGKTIDELKQYVLDIIMDIEPEMISEKTIIGFNKKN